MTYLYYLSLLFKVWMLVDLYQRRGDSFWYFVIFLIPGGEFVYFFVVKLRDLRGVERSLAKDFEMATGRSLTRLEADVAEAPSVRNMLALATGLFDRRKFAQAADGYRKVLERDPEDLSGLHGLGLSLLELGDPSAAVESLQPIVEVDPSFLRHSAFRHLVIALWRSGRREEALEEVRDLVGRDARTEHRAMLGEYLIDLGHREEAREVLKAARAHYEGSPGYVRRMNRPAYGRVKRLLALLAKDAR